MHMGALLNSHINALMSAYGFTIGCLYKCTFKCTLVFIKIIQVNFQLIEKLIAITERLVSLKIKFFSVTGTVSESATVSGPETVKRHHQPPIFFYLKWKVPDRFAKAIQRTESERRRVLEQDAKGFNIAPAKIQNIVFFIQDFISNL